MVFQEQYEFVYEALLEALKSGDTAIPCVDFRKRFCDLLKKNPDTGKVRLAEEFEVRVYTMFVYSLVSIVCNLSPLKINV